jgi:C1A family cysteine protease
VKKYLPRGLGWQRDIPDFRDYTPEHPSVRRILGLLKPAPAAAIGLPASVDLRDDCQPCVDDQEELNSCAAFAVLGLIECFERCALGQSCEPSRLFLYQTTLKLRGCLQDSGVDLRSTFKALRRVGTPREVYWPYRADRLRTEPGDPFLFAFDEFLPLCYLRFDRRRVEDGAGISTPKTGAQTLQTVKAFLAAGFPSVFGFSVPGSISLSGDVPFYEQSDVRGGQAVVAVGYDDVRGALLFRNSWGCQWGERGYGWLPYAYIEHGYAADFWTALKEDWVVRADWLRGEFLPLA